MHVVFIIKLYKDWPALYMYLELCSNVAPPLSVNWFAGSNVHTCKGWGYYL